MSRRLLNGRFPLMIRPTGAGCLDRAGRLFFGVDYGGRRVMIIREIRNAIHVAAEDKQKMAMFHFQVLKNAKVLDGMEPGAFCTAVDVPQSYHIEFRKMLGLARLMDALGVRLAADR